MAEEKGEEYRDYLKDLSSMRGSVLSLLSGFTFSTIAILLNQLPDPNSLISQFTLLFLTVIFNLLIFLLVWQTMIMVGAYDVRNPPEQALWDLTAFNLVMFTVFNLWGISLVLIFLLYNLTYLAVGSGIACILSTLASQVLGQRMRKRLGWSITDEIRRMRKRETS